MTTPDQTLETEDHWEDLERLVRQGDAAGAGALVATLPPGEVARTLGRLDEQDRTRLMVALEPALAADLLERIPDSLAAAIIEELPPERGAAIVSELPSDERADLLTSLDTERLEAILRHMIPEDAQQTRVLAGYAEDVAGGLMVTEYLAYAGEATVAEVVDDLRAHAGEYRDYLVQYLYVVDRERRLQGVLRMRDLLLAPREAPVASLSLRDPLRVRDTAGLDELRDLFDRHHYFGVPVVDAERRLVGLVRRADVEEALEDRLSADYLKTQGIAGGEELRTMPLLPRARRRLGWLSVNILLNVLAASVIAFYQETLEAVIALAVFLPIISDMSGCSGNQAVAVSLRELSLGLVRPADVARVWLKELSVGVINGIALGVLIGLVALLWKGNVWLGLVVGVALAVNTLVAVSIGGTVPLIVRRLGKDPALASGPVLTTVTDMCGFFLVLGLASAVLTRLV